MSDPGQFKVHQTHDSQGKEDTFYRRFLKKWKEEEEMGITCLKSLDV